VPLPSASRERNRPRSAPPLEEAAPAPQAPDEPDEARDPELVAEVLAGDRERFAGLVERHGRALLGFLARRARTREEARELFQESWVAAFEGLGSLRDRAGFRGWLLSIGHKLLLKRLRRAEALPLERAGELAGRAPERASGERRDLAAKIDRAVASLPPRQREVFELRAVQELSHAEIARLLAISEESSRASFYQAARKLRARLGDEIA
jgi:RNA polymerase sigma-70 factor (ECF subfamily)